MNSYITAHIDVAAFQHNLQVVKNKVGSAAILAMIKSNGYGHGLVRTAKALHAADGFGVARLNEAEELRASGIMQPITVFSGFASRAEMEKMSALNLDTVLFNFEQIELFAQHQLSRPLNVWLKIDTGMHRLGLLPTNLEKAYQMVKASKNLASPVRFLTHLACADEIENKRNAEQFSKFIECANGHGPKSIANSAALLSLSNTHADWVRPGIILYGVSPFAAQTGHDLGLKPVMTLQTKLIAINHVQKGDAIGYGGAWICPEDMRVGVAAVGYGDGYPRHAGSGTPVKVGDKISQLVGRVSMDLITIDLRNNADAKVGDRVVLWGPELPVETVAKCADTIPYELLCHVAPRVEFI